MPRTKMDPLLAAVIAKLPPSNTDWPQDAQLAWLRMMAMAMGTVYGGDAVGHLGKPAAPVPSVKRQAPVVHPFLIDRSGYARRVTGERVLAKEVNAPIFDERGEAGDMRNIIWADESTGLNGADLTIVA